MDDWPFDQPPNAAAITTRRELEGAPILLVAHDSDDHGWQFLDGSQLDVADGRVIGMGTALNIDPTLIDVADLPPGWIAERLGRSAVWTRRRSEDS